MIIPTNLNTVEEEAPPKPKDPKIVTSALNYKDIVKNVLRNSEIKYQIEHSP